MSDQPKLTDNDTLGVRALSIAVGGPVCRACPLYQVSCYGQRNLYRMTNVQLAQRRNARAFRSQSFSPADLAGQILRSKRPVRLFTVGDAQSISEVQKIRSVAQLCPNARVWWPTRVWTLGNDAVDILRQIKLECPSWTIRLSAASGALESIPWRYRKDFPLSLVRPKDAIVRQGFWCPKTPGSRTPVPHQRACHHCGFRCWDRSEEIVTYGQH